MSVGPLCFSDSSMDKRLILVVNWNWVSARLLDPKLQARKWFPLGLLTGWLGPDPDVLVRFRKREGGVELDPAGRIVNHKGMYYLQSSSLTPHLPAPGDRVAHVFLVVEGSKGRARITVHAEDGSLLERVQEEDPTLRLHAYDLPPVDVTIIETAAILRAVHAALRQQDAELHSRRADDFVRSPHILLALLSHVMELKSKDQIDFVSNLRCIADQLRDLLRDRIAKLEKSHQLHWAEWCGSRVSFADGGVSRISSLPGSEPLAIRVGVYTAIPGETDFDAREDWRLHPYVVGDILNDPPDPDEEYPSPPDPKRLQEAARYILEALTVLRHATGSNPPDILFLHGPLVNSFEMYDEGEPNYIPAVDPSFLASNGVTEAQVVGAVVDIPPRRGAGRKWNQAMAIYGYLMKRVFDLKIPVVGVVERSGSFSLRNAMLERFKRDGVITESLARKLRQRLDRFRITDELLFGCVLDEGVYLEPTPLQKNVVRRARDAWQPVVAQYPHPLATYLKTSPSSFPYRVEFNHAADTQNLERVMGLLYHTSLLLPEYAFPVGLDIVDKYAKVPDWLSRGVSAAIAAQVLAKAVTTGDPRVLQQVRRLLAQSPRDYFYRPRA